MFVGLNPRILMMRYEFTKDIRGDYVVVDRAPYPWKEKIRRYS